MEIQDLQALEKIAREAEAQGYVVRNFQGSESCIGHISYDFTVSFSRKIPWPETKPDNEEDTYILPKKS